MINEVGEFAFSGDPQFLSILYLTDIIRLRMWSGDKTYFLHKIFRNKVLMATIIHNQMQWIVFNPYLCMEHASYSFSSTVVKAI